MAKKRRSWKTDYLVLEKEYDKVKEDLLTLSDRILKEKESYEALHKSYKSVVGKLQVKTDEVESWKDANNSLHEKLKRYREYRTSLLIQIREIQNAFYPFFAIGKLKADLKKLYEDSIKKPKEF